MTWGIFSDSSCDLSSEEFGNYEFNFAAVPLKIRVGETEYTDNKSLDVNEMLSHMKRFKGASSSACPSPEEWAQEFRKCDQSIAVTMTSALSGTFNSAVVAKRMVLEECPQKRIHVIDSPSTAGGLVLILRKLAELISEGLNFDDVVDKAQAYTRTLHLLFALGSYDNLIKTGRMSKVAGILANSLGIRAVASNTPEGEIKVLQKPRGENRALSVIAELMAKMKNMAGLPVVISHCNNPVGAQRLKELITHVCLTKNITVMETRGLTSFYTESGGILVGF